MSSDADSSPSPAEAAAVEDPLGAETPVHWIRVGDRDVLEEGRVRTVAVGRRTIALTRCDGRYGALDNRCPHQGGPLGEGAIEKGWLRCPWHGYDYDPITGVPPGGFSDRPTAYEVDERPDGIWVAVPDEPPHERTVSDVLVETMVAWGVTHVFGMVGHSNLGFADAMRRAEARGELTYIGIRHEGAASFAASAYGKLTGRLAACFAIAGPGSTNLLTGLYDAKIDRAPVLAVSGQVPSKVRGRGAFQDLDLTAAFDDATTSSTVVQAGSDHAELMALACKHALDQRQVAHLVLPDEVQVLPAPGVASSPPAGRVATHPAAPDESAVAEAAARIDGSERPVVVIGHGALGGVDEVVRLAEHLGAPLLTTFKAKGLVPDDHPLACGVLGRSGTPVASWMMNECDLLVVFGASFSNHTGIAPYKPIVQVDADPAGLGRFHPVEIPILGDAAVTARRLRAFVSTTAARADQAAELAERWRIWRAEKRRRMDDDQGNGVASAAVFDAMSRLVPTDAVLTVDVGNHAYSFGRYFESRGQRVLMSGYLGSIGFGLPAAMGAWAADPGRRVLAVTGDGGFGQYLAELTTAVKYGMGITHVLLDNSELGKIAKEQRAEHFEVWQTGLHNPDFAEYARLCGAVGLRVERREQLDGALEEALAVDGPALVHVITDPELV
ncbi:MAG: thiamine pyrophosphate-binding protein [Acidimicrobiales bacterium]